MRTPELPIQLITPDLVRDSIKRAKVSLTKAAEEIVWQIEREAWVTLGYSSWDAMRQAEYGDAAFMVPRKDRPELVGRMRAAGLTQKESADTIGVTTKTVRRDEHPERKGTNVPSEPKPLRRRPLPDSYGDATWKARKAVESLTRLHRDDRFKANRVALERHHSWLAMTANELLKLLDDLGIDRHKYGGDG